MAYDGDTFFDCHAPQFSMEDLEQIFFRDTILKLQNWITAGYVEPDYWKDPRGGRERRRFSIVHITRISIIDLLVNCIGIKPSQAAEVADFCAPFLNDIFDRHPDGEKVSTAHMYVETWLNRDGTTTSSVYYRKLDDPTPYMDDPYQNPDAKPYLPLQGITIQVPLTQTFFNVFLRCAELLKRERRGGLDKFRRLVDAD